MSIPRLPSLLAPMTITLLGTTALHAQTPVGTAFTYQGQLTQAGAPLNNMADFEFTLWDAATDGTQVGPLVPVNNWPIQDGLFTVLLDFGDGVFTGNARWLEIAVRSPAGSGDFTTLSPRQELTAVPYALFARSSLITDVAPPLDLTWDGPFTIRGTNEAAGVGVVGRNTGTGIGLQALSTGTGAAFSASIANATNAADALTATTNGTGRAVNASITNAASAADAMVVTTNGTGRAVNVSITKAASAADALTATTNGTGRAGVFVRSNNGAQNPALSASTAGVNSGVYGVSGNLPQSTGRAGGVQGVSKDRAGVAGSSENSNGVWGATGQAGTYAAAEIVGGVHGISAIVDDVDNFAVVGTGNGYGTGVLGVGAGGGHGVIGVCGRDPGHTNVGVRGSTREKADGTPGWPAAFPLERDPSKEMVGVLGQGYKYVGVWGESREKFGLVGNSGDPLAFTGLPDTENDVVSGVYGTATQDNGIGVLGETTNFVGVWGSSQTEFGVVGHTGDALPPANLPQDTVAGVYGKASQTGAVGVLAESTSADSADAAVRAVGNGSSGAAALDIRNGALAVSGATRPAGTLDVSTLIDMVPGCYVECPECTVDCCGGWYFEDTLANGLIDPNSIILLTVETSAPSIVAGVTANVTTKTVGSATIRVTVFPGDLNSDSVCDFFDIAPLTSLAPKVHYLIINPGT